MVSKWLIMVNKINNDFSQEAPCLRFEWVLNTPVSPVLHEGRGRC